MGLVARIGAVDGGFGVHMGRANGQLGARPPRDVALVIAVHEVDSRRVHHGRGLRNFFQALGAGKSEEGLVQAVFRILRKGPPHGHVVFNERAVVGAAQFKRYRFSARHFNGFSVGFDVAPFVPVQVAVTFYGLLVQVNVVIDEHGNAP